MSHIYYTMPDFSFIHYPHTATEYDYTDEFTAEDEAEVMASQTIHLDRQTENNKRYPGSDRATFYLAESMSSYILTVSAGGLRPVASVELTRAELEKVADLVDKTLGRKPRVKAGPTIKGSYTDGQIVVENVTVVVDVAPPF